MKKDKLYLGTSGWSYKDWRGIFYPARSSNNDWLSQYAETFSTVEIDSTFYGIPRSSTVEKWQKATPDHFIFAPKVPRTITHENRLQRCSPIWDHFLETMALLGDKLGPIVLQFDYKFTFKDHFQNLKQFLEKETLPPKLCVEIRNKDWHRREFYELLEAHHTALVLNDLYYMPRVIEITTDFTYIRLLGNRKLIPDDFSSVRINRDRELDWWSQRIVRFLEKNLEVYVYSNNRYQGHAPATMHSLKERLV